MDATRETAASQTIASYVACATLEDRAVDWAEIHDALEELDGLSFAEAQAAIAAYREARQS